MGPVAVLEFAWDRAIEGMAFKSSGSVSVSCLRRVDGGIEVRLVGMSEDPTVAVITGAFDRVDTVDLLQRELSTESADGRITVRLDPWEIRTLRLAAEDVRLS